MLSDAVDRARDNPVGAAAVALAVLLVIGGGIFTANMVSGSGLSAQAAPQKDLADRTEFDADRGGDGGGTGDAGAGAFVEVQEASYDVASDDAESTAADVTTMADRFDGYVESRSKTDRSLETRVRMTVRVPDDRFAAFSDEFRSEFEVETYDVRNYRVSIQEELDELDVLNRTLRDYEEIRERVLQGETTTEDLQLLADLTERELWVVERQRHYRRQLSESRQRGAYATIDVTITEQKAVDLAPDNVGNRFRNAVKEMVDSVVTISIDTVTGVVTLFFKVLQVIVYLVVVIVPFAIAYRVGKRLYREYWPES